MSQYTGERPRHSKKYIEKSPEWRLEQMQYHNRQSLRQDEMLCSMFGINETELTAQLRRIRKTLSDYLYTLEKLQDSSGTPTQETLVEID